ncbi:hypothetical protein J5Y03_02655 [Bacillus sp. RG28]|uniref:Uncharacterized protein n=1 Tax=Gottfriedia endophytica TaxID=2820819 RepID=A0A940SFK1_9BACI|nr:hypothetical protein [Gottfriedia endophytica]MBP0724082.1 hypothetical protein [Gottfriedia endophytica]
MRKNYCSLHIFDADIEEVEIYLSDCDLDNLPNHPNTKLLNEFISKNSINENSSEADQLSAVMKLISQVKEVKAVFYLSKTENVVNVYSEYLTFETIKDCVMNWFGKSGKKIVAVSNLDNDVIEISLYREGKFTTSGIFGNIESYGFSKSCLSINEINSFFNLQCVEEIQVDELSQVDEIYSYFKDLFNLPIGLSHKEFKGAKSKQFTKFSVVI